MQQLQFIAHGGLDEFPNSEAIRGFAGRDGNVLTHKNVS